MIDIFLWNLERIFPDSLFGIRFNPIEFLISKETSQVTFHKKNIFEKSSTCFSINKIRKLSGRNVYRMCVCFDDCATSRLLKLLFMPENFASSHMCAFERVRVCVCANGFVSRWGDRRRRIERGCRVAMTAIPLAVHARPLAARRAFIGTNLFVHSYHTLNIYHMSALNACHPYMRRLLARRALR